MWLFENEPLALRNPLEVEVEEKSTNALRMLLKHYKQPKYKLGIIGDKLRGSCSLLVMPGRRKPPKQRSLPKKLGGCEQFAAICRELISRGWGYSRAALANKYSSPSIG